MKFLVAKRGKQGKFKYKGEVEVKKVWMTYSEVHIIEVYGRDAPLIDGDMLVNPLYNPNRSMIVCFAGEQRLNRAKFSSVQEATNRIIEMGGTVRKEIGLDVDYVIFTETASQRQRSNYEAFNKAVFLEIPIAEAAEIYKFLGD